MIHQRYPGKRYVFQCPSRNCQRPEAKEILAQSGTFLVLCCSIRTQSRLCTRTVFQHLGVYALEKPVCWFPHRKALCSLELFRGQPTHTFLWFWRPRLLPICPPQLQSTNGFLRSKNWWRVMGTQAVGGGCWCPIYHCCLLLTRLK